MNKIRAWYGPAILSYGFRPFFLLAGLWAALAMILWIAMLAGHAPLVTRFDPFSWHAHEFVFGYVPAVIAGFLLTAVPNWTGRLPVVGWPLLGLSLLWLVGRLAIGFSSLIPNAAATLADLSFGAAMIFFLAREIISGRNWRNLPVLALLTLLLVANGVFHWEFAHGSTAGENSGLRLGVAAEIMLIILVGGRIVPSFTRNWLAQRKAAALPLPMGWPDRLAIAAAVFALALFVAIPETHITGAVSAIAGLANLWRLSRWKSWQTFREPLLWVLHLGYAFAALGFLSVACGAWGALPLAGALHMWLVGAISLMTLAVMTRATRGHTGRALTAPPSTALIYLLALVAVAARVAAASLASFTMPLLYLAAVAWVAAYILFVVIYGPILLRAKVKN